MGEFVVYSKDHCPQCNATLRWLGQREIVHEVRDAVGEIGLLKEWGYSAAPVVVAPDGRKWSGFRPDLLDEYV